MARWLVKEEPSHYSFEDLLRDRETQWSGVHNPLALQHLRSMRNGEEGVFYHTGSVKAVVGWIRIAGSPHPDPADARGSWAVGVRAVEPLGRPVTLLEMRGDKEFTGFELLRNSRLSIVPIPDRSWKRLKVLSRAPIQSGQRPRANQRAARARNGGSA